VHSPFGSGKPVIKGPAPPPPPFSRACRKHQLPLFFPLPRRKEVEADTESPSPTGIWFFFCWIAEGRDGPPLFFRCRTCRPPKVFPPSASVRVRTQGLETPTPSMSQILSFFEPGHMKSTWRAFFPPPELQHGQVTLFWRSSFLRLPSFGPDGPRSKVAALLSRFLWTMASEPGFLFS